jgi:PAS domain S-box-containing protein
MTDSRDIRLATIPGTGALPGATGLSYESELILDAVPDGVVAIDREGRTTLVNEAASKMLLWSPAELIGRPLHDVVHGRRPDGSAYPAEECPINRTLATGEVHQIETDVFWRKDGSSLPVEFNSRPVRRDGAIAGAIVAFRDLSERHRAREGTRQLVREQFARATAEFQHAQLRDILVQAPAVICVTRGPVHAIDTANEQYRQIIGQRVVSGLPFREALPDVPSEHTARLDRAYETGEPCVGSEVPGLRLFGTGAAGRFFNFVVQPLRDETGAVYGLMTHAVDVTEQVCARHELEERTAELQNTTERFRLAAEAGHLGAWEWEIGTGRVIWSPELERIHGLEPGMFAGTFEAYQRDMHPDDQERVLRTIRETVSEHRPHLLEYRIVLPDGTVRWVEARGRMILDAQGKPERVVGVCMDVSERKQAEQELAVRHRLAALMADVGMILTRGDELPAMLQACAESVVMHIDAALARIWTLNPAEGILQIQASAGLYTHLDGRHSRVRIGELTIGWIAQERRPHMTNHVAGDERISDTEWARRERLVSFAGYPLMAGNELVGVLAMFARHPLTPADLQALGSVAHSVAVGIQKKRHKEALRQSEQNLRRRAAELSWLTAALERSNRELDAFAYAASHDLRAPLRGIANLAQWIEEDLSAQSRLKEETAEMLQLMRSRMHRMEALIEGLLQYSRAGRAHRAPETVDIGRLVKEVVDLLGPPESATIEIDPGLPTIAAERLPLQQVLLNLVGNALKHARRDDVRIAVRAREQDEAWEFSVQDNGPGVAPEFHERIWGIFQTLESRDRVEATGIGLALVKKLVESQGGRAWVESSRGEGATFKFLWPKQAS